MENSARFQIERQKKERQEGEGHAVGGDVGIWCDKIIITYGKIAGKCKEYDEGKYGKESTG
jgi:hypothetical protein